MDFFDLLIREDDIKVIVMGENLNLSKSTDYQEEIKSGKLVFKRGKVLKFHENSVTFQDGSTEPIHSVVYATGYYPSYYFDIPDSPLVYL